MADAHGGRPVLALGVLAWSLCTILTPVAANVSLTLLLLMRVVLGVGEGVAMPAMNALVAACVPAEERARALSFIYSGMYGGSIVGLLVTPPLMAIADWRLVFYVCGGVGMLWTVLFWAQTAPAEEIAPVEQTLAAVALLDVEEGQDDVEQEQEGEALQRKGNEEEGEVRTPTLREMLSRGCVWAIIVAHLCCTWGYFVLLSWLPTYLNERFGLDVSQSALWSTAPWVAMAICANVGGQLADMMVRRGVSTTTVRKTMQTVGFAGPALFLALLSAATRAGSAMRCVTAALALGAFSQSGVYSNHQDIAPRAAGTLLGVSNTFASMPGLIGVALSGFILQRTHNNWAAVFALAIAFYLIGLFVYLTFATSRRQW